ncbi:hypothetical protein ACFX13_002753 [Malus domestica]
MSGIGITTPFLSIDSRKNLPGSTHFFTKLPLAAVGLGVAFETYGLLLNVVLESRVHAVDLELDILPLRALPVPGERIRPDIERLAVTREIHLLAVGVLGVRLKRVVANIGTFSVASECLDSSIASVAVALEIVCRIVLVISIIIELVICFVPGLAVTREPGPRRHWR